MEDYILQIEHVTKVFPGVKALDDINIKVKRGEIHALCGENGAGKSTLINIISGVYPADSYEGTIIINGKAQSFRSIRDAELAGVGCIHQELALAPEMSVAENIFLGNQPTNGLGIIRWNELYAKTEQYLAQMNLDIGLEEKVKNLGVGKKQLVEIVKSLTRDSKLLILDEPTSALTDVEVATLFEVLFSLREKGVTCIYISHKLDEIFTLADTISVIRDGRSIGTVSAGEIDKAGLIQMMVGREMTSMYPREPHTRGEVGFSVAGYTVYDPEIPGKKRIDNVSFEAHRGEILGIAGLMGAGRTELFSSLFGMYGADRQGDVFIDGTPVEIQSPRDAMKNGYVLVSEDRKRFGLNLEMSIKENTTLSSLDKVSRFGLIDKNAEIKYTEEYVQRMRTKTPSIETLVKNLSGGNQQKVVLGKALMVRPKVLVFDEPTRGIDVGAKFEIYKVMNQFVEEGVVVIMISSELEEVLGMSDRVIVLCDGKITANMDVAEATQEKLASAMIGEG